MRADGDSVALSGSLQSPRRCRAQRGQERIVIIRAGNVVTMDGVPITGGAVRVHGDRIVEVGKFSELAAPSKAFEAKGPVVDLGEHVLLPGLINAHCHLDYTCLRGKIPRQNSFADWIRVINAEKAKLTRNDYLRS